MKMFVAIERDQFGVRGVIANFQISAVHMRQSVAHHAVGVFRAPGADRESF